MKRIYLDHASTTPMHPDVIAAVAEASQTYFANPSSTHTFGREAKQRMEAVRRTAAKSIGAEAKQIIFTSGGTESDNLAILGVAAAAEKQGKKGHMMTTMIEHHAVLKAFDALEKRGWDVTYLSPSSEGFITADQVEEALKPSTVLVSIMAANNEVGTLQPIGEIGARLLNHPVLFHTDAVQVYGIQSLQVDELNVDFLTTAAHKLNGPNGVGFLYVRHANSIESILHGGSQERQHRAGTENIAGLCGFEKAIELTQAQFVGHHDHLQKLKTRFLSVLEDAKLSFSTNGASGVESLPSIVNLCFPDVRSDQLLMNLDLEGVAASSGSACTAGTLEPSHVVQAMWPDLPERAMTSVRFSFGVYMDVDEVEQAAKRTVTIIRRLSKNN